MSRSQTDLSTQNQGLIMSSVTVEPTRTTTTTARRQLPRSAAFYLLASIVMSFLAGSAAPTPLYALYQATWGFTPITTTIVFGVYAVAVLAALLVVGSLSDHIGRRPVLIVAVLVQAITMIIFARATGVSDLFAARIVQGLSTGAALGAVGAGLLDLDRVRGTVANAVGPMTGSAVGSLIAGLLVQFLPAPTHLVYLVFAVVFVVQAIGVMLMAEPEPAGRRPGALASLRPQFGVPARVRGALVKAIPALVAAWALVGFYASLGPAVVGQVADTRNFVVRGLILFAMAGGGALAVLVLRNTPARTMLRIGMATMLVGVGIGLLAINVDSTVWFFLAAVVTGSGLGAGFQGALRTVVPLAAPDERAGVLSIVYVISYLAMGLPAVIAGVLVVHSGGLLSTARYYSLAVMVLALAALAGTWTERRRPARSAAKACPEAA